ncbi:MAG: ferredoxin--NADP reductase [Bacteroidia bacterium]
MKQQFNDAEIIDIIDVNSAIKRFFFKVLHTDKFDFKPGQFVMINLPIDSKISYRSYSIASAPNGTNIFELIIVLNPPGMGTPYMWDNFKKGMIVPVAGPLGKFNLPENILHDICFISTGTGIAPLRSMLHHIYNTKMHHHRIYFIFGSRKKEDLLYKDELEDLQKTHPEFHYIPVLSRETPETWYGRIGYVHQVYEEIFHNKRPAHFYLCGWTAMLKEARERLALMGYTKEHIKFENYD